MSRFEDFRYDRPGTFRAIVVIVVAGALICGVAWMPDNDFTKTIGVSGLKRKGSALRNAMYWEVRAVMNPAVPTTPAVDFGFLQGVDFDGKIIASVPQKNVYVLKKLVLADIQLTNKEGAAAYVAGIRTTDARLDIYGDMVVVWINEQPLNVKMIEAGFAIPDPNPPTNIVDKAFATYYWRIFNGASND